MADISKAKQDALASIQTIAQRMRDLARFYDSFSNVFEANGLSGQFADDDLSKNPQSAFASWTPDDVAKAVKWFTENFRVALSGEFMMLMDKLAGMPK